MTKRYRIQAAKGTNPGPQDLSSLTQAFHQAGVLNRLEKIGYRSWFQMEENRWNGGRTLQGSCFKNYVPPIAENVGLQETLFDDHVCVFIPDIVHLHGMAATLQLMPGLQWINIGIKRLVSSSSAMNRKMISTLPIFLEER